MAGALGKPSRALPQYKSSPNWVRFAKSLFEDRKPAQSWQPAESPLPACLRAAFIAFDVRQLFDRLRVRQFLAQQVTLKHHLTLPTDASDVQLGCRRRSRQVECGLRRLVPDDLTCKFFRRGGEARIRVDRKREPVTQCVAAGAGLGVFGPVLRNAFLRLAAICFSELMTTTLSAREPPPPAGSAIWLRGDLARCRRRALLAAVLDFPQDGVAPDLVFQNKTFQNRERLQRFLDCYRVDGGFIQAVLSQQGNDFLFVIGDTFGGT